MSGFEVDYPAGLGDKINLIPPPAFER